MYVFSVNAIASEATPDFSAGQMVPFIVYINAPALEGAKKLCVMHLLRAGFSKVEIEKQKKIAANVLSDKKRVAAHSGLKEAMAKGYAIHVFDED